MDLSKAKTKIENNHTISQINMHEQHAVKMFGDGFPQTDVYCYVNGPKNQNENDSIMMRCNMVSLLNLATHT